MKIGDKIKVVATGRVGLIIGETANGWKIDFEDGIKPELVSKGTPMEILTSPSLPWSKPSPAHKRFENWVLWIAVGIAFVILTVFLASIF
jgi:hypothetical protein